MFHDVPETRINDLHKVTKRYIDVEGAERHSASEQQKQLMLQRVHIARVVSAPKATETGSEVALVAGDSVRVRLPLRQLGASEALLRFLGLSAIPVPGGEQL